MYLEKTGKTVYWHAMTTIQGQTWIALVLRGVNRSLKKYIMGTLREMFHKQDRGSLSVCVLKHAEFPWQFWIQLPRYLPIDCLSTSLKILTKTRNKLKIHLRCLFVLFYTRETNKKLTIWGTRVPNCAGVQCKHIIQNHYLRFIIFIFVYLRFKFILDGANQ